MFDDLVDVAVLDAVLVAEFVGIDTAVGHGFVVVVPGAAHELRQLSCVHQAGDVLLAGHLQLVLLLLRQRLLDERQHEADDGGQLVDDDVVGAAREIVQHLDEVVEHADVGVGDARALAVEHQSDSLLVHPVDLLGHHGEEAQEVLIPGKKIYLVIQ